MSLPELITTERLSLPLWSPAEVADLRAGVRRVQWHPDFPREDDVDAAGMWVEGDRFGPRSIVRGQTTLGSIGCFGPPSPAADGVPEAEIGYGLVAEARGWGFATEAVVALVAALDADGIRVRASVRPDNKPSLRVLATSGFTTLRGSDDEGHLVMVRPPRDGSGVGSTASTDDSLQARLRADLVAARRGRVRADAAAAEAVVRSEIAELLVAADVSPPDRAAELRARVALLEAVLEP